MNRPGPVADDPLDPTTPARLEAVVRGVVQGVGYRYFAWREASDLALGGWVANERDGSVHCVAEGPRGRLAEFAELLREGPPGSLVERVDVVWSSATGSFTSFGIRSGGHSGD